MSHCVNRDGQGVCVRAEGEVISMKDREWSSAVKKAECGRGMGTTGELF